MILAVLLFAIVGTSRAQTLPSSRATDWTKAGLVDTSTTPTTIIDLQNAGLIADGTTANDTILDSILNTLSPAGAVLEFPNGDFLFNNTIALPSNVVLRGQGMQHTQLIMDLGGQGHGIQIQGSAPSDSSIILQSTPKDSFYLQVWNSQNFAVGDWVQIKQQDADLIHSSWAANSVGQILQIDSISGQMLWFRSPLRMDCDTARQPYLIQLNPKKNCGIECLKIKRIDDTAPQLSANILFKHAVNCWVKNIESENCTFSHVRGEQSSNLYVGHSYFHHGFTYGGNGRAYGVTWQYTTGECLVEDNIFEHLRHSILLQAGANGNVFTFNYSFDPYWDNFPNNGAGDMVLHGNYPYCNLFEQNIVQNIVIDNSHGANGPYNTFFRNRAESYGIIFSSTTSPMQNLVGNEITNDTFPFSLLNFSIQGNDHFLHGNDNKGTIVPTNTNNLPDTSYFYSQAPDFISNAQWSAIGTPNPVSSGTIPAKNRVVQNNFGVGCSEIIMTTTFLPTTTDFMVYPNPIDRDLNLESKKKMENIYICNELGQTVYQNSVNAFTVNLQLPDLANGIYVVRIQFADNSSAIQKVVKINY